MEPQSSPSLNQLLQHQEFARRLARSLLSESDAADALQDTWLAALRRPPRALDHSPGSGHLRAWAARVVRNAAAELRRGEGRRREHELRAGARSPERAVDESVAELEQHRRLSDAVLALPEPARTAVVLRYFEGLEPRAIAARTGVPVETARSRVKRGVELLRRRLDSGPGGRDAWVQALAPLLAPASPALLIGGLTMLAKPVLAAAALVVVGAVTWTLTRPDESRAQPSGVEEAVEPALVAATPVEEPEVAVTGPDERAPAPVAPAAASSAARVATGRVVVLDASAREWSELDGVLQLREESGATRDVPVTAGQWSVDLGAAPWLEPTGGHLGEFAVRFQAETRIDPETTMLLALHDRRVVLEVVAADTGAALTDVEVSLGGYSSPRQALPFVRDAVARGDSPIQLPARSGREDFWVRAPGFAWRHVAIDFTKDEREVVELQPAGELELVLTPESALADPELGGEILLQLNDEEFGLLVGSTDAAVDGPTLIESLRPGSYTVFASLTALNGASSTSLGRVAVDVRVGERSTAELPLDPSKLSAARAPMAGVLRIPVCSVTDEVVLRLLPTSAPHQRPTDLVEIPLGAMQPGALPGEWRWDAGRRGLGPYVLGVWPFQVLQRVELDAPGRTDVLLEVGALAELQLSVIDSETGAPLEVPFARWSIVLDEAVSWQSSRAEPTGAPGHFRAWVPPGPLEIGLQVPTTQTYDERIDVPPEGGEFEIAVRPALGFHLSWRDGDEVLPFGGTIPRVKGLDGASFRLISTSSNDPRIWISVHAPGTFVVEVVATPEGFRPVEPFEVVVPADRIEDVVIQLERE